MAGNCQSERDTRVLPVLHATSLRYLAADTDRQRPEYLWSRLRRTGGRNAAGYHVNGADPAMAAVRIPERPDQDS